MGRYRRRGSAIGPQLELLADAVFGLAALAVEVLVERSGVVGGAAQRGDDEAGVGALRGMLGLTDDAALAAPAVERAVAKIAEQPRRFGGGGAPALRLCELGGNGLLQALIACQTEHVINAVHLAPVHQRFARKA